MAKALELSTDTLTAPPIPKAAQVAPQPLRGKAGKEATKPEIKREPLQVRWPREEVTAVKIASLQQGFSTVSDFMLACFHAYMKTSKKDGE